MALLERTDLILEREAIYFHSCFFDEELSQDVVRRYIEANRRFLAAGDERSRNMIDTVILHRLDVESVEYALRLKEKDNILTKKIQVLFFLIEVRSRYFGYFYNCEKATLRAGVELCIACIMTVYKFIKGKYLIWRYDLV